MIVRGRGNACALCSRRCFRSDRICRKHDAISELRARWGAAPAWSRTDYRRLLPWSEAPAQPRVSAGDGESATLSRCARLAACGGGQVECRTSSAAQARSASRRRQAGGRAALKIRSQLEPRLATMGACAGAGNGNAVVGWRGCVGREGRRSSGQGDDDDVGRAAAAVVTMR